MRILKKRNILKLAATFMLVGMMAGAFAMQTKAAVAAPCPGGITIPSGGTCDSTLSASLTDSNLLFTSDATITASNPVVGTTTNPFSFVANVKDLRNVDHSQGSGWRLQALSTGLTGPSGSAADLVISATGNTCTYLVTTTATDCTGVTYASATLNSGHTSPQTFATEASQVGTLPDGEGHTFTVTTNGTFIIPPTYTVGTYTGTITLSLLNTAA